MKADATATKWMPIDTMPPTRGMRFYAKREDSPTPPARGFINDAGAVQLSHYFLVPVGRQTLLVKQATHWRHAEPHP